MSGIGDQLIIQYGPIILEMLVKGLILPLLGFAIAWIANKTRNDKLKTRNDKLKDFIATTEATIRKCVQAANQDIVDGIKGTDAWTKEKQDEIFANVTQDVLAIMAEDGLAQLNKYTGDGLLWINNTILDYVRSLKKEV